MNKKLLICDDDVDIVEMLEIVFEDCGVEVISETDSKKVLALITHLHPDLVLMDLWMPVITGDQVLKRMRADSGLSSIPVLIMSAAQDGREVAMQAGADGYIAKPFDVDQLLKRVQEMIALN
ncbi:response regulator [Pedobacter sp. KLB.chiD]|uniref:response regulator n=1 Tax=Pedobacter sp. KLB.chiD TaxID=3387402 RepID=UPI00399B390A